MNNLGWDLHRQEGQFFERTKCSAYALAQQYDFNYCVNDEAENGAQP